MQEIQVTFAGPRPPPRLHADTSAVQAEGAVGGELCLYLKAAQSELQQMLRTLRRSMQLTTVDTASTAVSAEDSMALWSAWRETLFAAIEDAALLAIEAEESDRAGVAQRRREAIERLETLQRSLRTHAVSLDDALVQLRNAENTLRQTAAAAATALCPLSQPSGAYTVSYNAAVAIDGDRTAARLKLHAHADGERKLVIGVLSGLHRAVTTARGRHSKGVEELRRSAEEALRVTDGATATQRVELVGACRALRRRYEAEVHAPLLKLLGTAGASTVTYETEIAALTDEVDPTCSARCAASLRELVQLRSNVERDAIDDAALDDPHNDDPDRHLARARARVDAARAQCEREQRLLALQREEVAAQQALDAARDRLVGLQRQATEAEWGFADAVAGLARSTGKQRKMTAALVTAARERRSQIADELERAGAEIGRHSAELASLASTLAETDREGQLERRFTALEAVRVLCEQMQVAFAEVDQSDTVLRRLMTAQLRQGIRESGGHAASAVRRAVDLARTRLSGAMVQVRAIRDDALEIQRRVTELATARAEQQAGISGTEMAAYAALEELAAANHQLNDVLDAVVRSEAMRQGCKEAQNVTGAVIRQLIMEARSL
jgi:hypothetical protein